MKKIIGKLCIWILRKLKISVMLNVEINIDKKYCKPKYNLSETWYVYSKGIAFFEWDIVGHCTFEDLTPVEGENSITAIMIRKI